jgi:K+-sensing histidine kinase KdpD
MDAVQLLRLEKGNESPGHLQARAIIERQTGQLKHLVDDLLEVSRIATGRIVLRREPVAVSELVERAVETCRPVIRKHRHDLEVSLVSQPMWLNGDAARLEQVVVNLLTNAAKYTDDGGRIWLTVRQEGDACVLRVRDTGVGIAPQLLAKVFDLFMQVGPSLDRSHGGLGIGLCLVRQFVELHGGTVAASSVPGRGSEFVVRLPVAARPSPPAASDTGTARQTCPLRVLVVDDNVDAAQGLGMLLNALGHDVRVAHDGPSALQAAVDYLPNAALLDIGLPGLSGLEVAKRIRQQPPFSRTSC